MHAFFLHTLECLSHRCHLVDEFAGTGIHLRPPLVTGTEDLRALLHGARTTPTLRTILCHTAIVAHIWDARVLAVEIIGKQ